MKRRKVAEEKQEKKDPRWKMEKGRKRKCRGRIRGVKRERLREVNNREGKKSGR